MMRSIEHDTLGAMGLRWMAARCGSFRGNTEIQLKRGYVADAACLSVPYHRIFMDILRFSGMEPPKISYEIEGLGSIQVNAEPIPIPCYFSTVFEAKATRSDFLKTFRRGGHDGDRSEPVANLHYVVTERDICEPGELPEFWGLLVRRGRGLSLVRQSKFRHTTELDLLRLADRLLWVPPDHRRKSVHITHCPNCESEYSGESAPARHWRNRIPRHLDQETTNEKTEQEKGGDVVENKKRRKRLPGTEDKLAMESRGADGAQSDRGAI